MIKLEGIGYRIGEKWLVRDINITIEKGMLWGFVGPQRCGEIHTPAADIWGTFADDRENSTPW